MGVAICIPEVNYCQGMNHIARFFFNILEDEEVAFYIMLGIFEYTEISLIFVNDLLKLKQCFYVLDKLIKLYLPELFSCFKVNLFNQY